MTERKDATKATKEVNDRLLEELPFEDRRDFEDAERGFIASLPDGGVIKGEDGGRGRAKTALRLRDHLDRLARGRATESARSLWCLEWLFRKSEAG